MLRRVAVTLAAVTLLLPSTVMAQKSGRSSSHSSRSSTRSRTRHRNQKALQHDHGNRPRNLWVVVVAHSFGNAILMLYWYFH
jgi:hypothetical protein